MEGCFLATTLLFIIVQENALSLQLEHLLLGANNSSCSPGWYGFKCVKKCPSACAVCDHNATCLQCADLGFRLPSCTRECSKNRYGQNCKNKCDNACLNSECESKTGFCIACRKEGFSLPTCTLPCLPGTFGLHCQGRCPASCKDNCDRLTGLCKSCDVGEGPRCTVNCALTEHEETCSLRCPARCVGWCNTTDRRCSMCTPGYKAPHCREYCDSGTYGSRCNHSCSHRCLERKCDPVHGDCESCVKGYVGKRCNGKCIAGLFGADCLQPCPETCAEGLCNARTGECERCPPGYTGPVCDRLCAGGKHGDNCSLACPLMCRWPCNPVSGNCEECAAGYQGPSCNDSCSGGSYGLRCNRTCPMGCLNEVCHPVTGNCEQCKEFFHGPRCVRFQPSKVQPFEVVIYSVLCLLTPVVLLGVVISCYKHRSSAEIQTIMGGRTEPSTRRKPEAVSSQRRRLNKNEIKKISSSYKVLMNQNLSHENKIRVSYNTSDTFRKKKQNRHGLCTQGIDSGFTRDRHDDSEENQLGSSSNSGGTEAQNSSKVLVGHLDTGRLLLSGSPLNDSRGKNHTFGLSPRCDLHEEVRETNPTSTEVEGPLKVQSEIGHEVPKSTNSGPSSYGLVIQQQTADQPGEPVSRLNGAQSLTSEQKSCTPIQPSAKVFLTQETEDDDLRHASKDKPIDIKTLLRNPSQSPPRFPLRPIFGGPEFQNPVEHREQGVTPGVTSLNIRVTENLVTGLLAPSTSSSRVKDAYLPNQNPEKPLQLLYPNPNKTKQTPAYGLGSLRISRSSPPFYNKAIATQMQRNFVYEKTSEPSIKYKDPSSKGSENSLPFLTTHKTGSTHRNKTESFEIKTWPEDESELYQTEGKPTGSGLKIQSHGSVGARDQDKTCITHLSTSNTTEVEQAELVDERETVSENRPLRLSTLVNKRVGELEKNLDLDTQLAQQQWLVHGASSGAGPCTDGVTQETGVAQQPVSLQERPGGHGSNQQSEEQQAPGDPESRASGSQSKEGHLQVPSRRDLCHFTGNGGSKCIYQQSSRDPLRDYQSNDPRSTDPKSRRPSSRDPPVAAAAGSSRDGGGRQHSVSQQQRHKWLTGLTDTVTSSSEGSSQSLQTHQPTTSRTADGTDREGYDKRREFKQAHHQLPRVRSRTSGGSDRTSRRQQSKSPGLVRCATTRNQVSPETKQDTRLAPLPTPPTQGRAILRPVRKVSRSSHSTTSTADSASPSVSQ